MSDTYIHKGIPSDLLTSAEINSRRLKVQHGTDGIQRTRPFLNPSYGGGMNIDARFSGTPILITDGGDNAGWTAVIIAGAWNLSDTLNPYAGTRCVSRVAANDLDAVKFTGSAVDGSTRSAISVQFRIENYTTENHSIDLSLSLAGTPIGNTVNIVDYINSAMFNEYQEAVISMSDLGVSALSFDEATISVSRVGGTKPSFRLDNFKIEESGGGVSFEVSTDAAGDLSINRIRMSMVSGVTGLSAADHSKMIGVILENGIALNRTSGGVVAIGRRFSSLFDLYSSGFNELLMLESTSSTLAIIEIFFDTAIILRAATNDKISLSLSDDLSPFLLFTAIARGSSAEIPS